MAITNRLVYDSTDANTKAASSTVGAYLLDGAGNAVTSTDGALNVNADEIATLSHDHYEIHLGNHFSYNVTTLVDDGEYYGLYFSVGSGEAVPHIVWGISADAIVQVALYESPTITTGAAVVTRNNNRNYSDTLQNVTIGLVTTITAPGTELYKELILATNQTPGTTSRDNEFVLKPSTTYLLRVQSNTDGTVISFRVSGYESTDGVP